MIELDDEWRADEPACAKHPREVLGYEGRLEDLARAVGNLTYDQTRDFIQHLAKDIERQGENDMAGGRVRLARELYECASHLYDAFESMANVWDVCEPYMPRTINNQNSGKKNDGTNGQ